MLIESHRGLVTRFPENTIASFRGAKEAGYDMIELDPRFTSDGHCVILHNRTLEKNARDAQGNPPDPSVAIHDITLAEAKKYEYGSWFAPEFKGEQLAELKDVLAFALENKIPMKFDNVWHTHTEQEQETFLREIASSPAAPYCELTCLTVDAVKKAIGAIEGVKIHYDGMWSAEVKKQLKQLLPKDRLTVWRRMDNACTSWCKVPPITVEEATDIHDIASLGLWLLKEQQELEEAGRYNADIIETDGSIAPNPR